MCAGCRYSGCYHLSFRPALCRVQDERFARIGSSIPAPFPNPLHSSFNGLFSLSRAPRCSASLAPPLHARPLPLPLLSSDTYRTRKASGEARRARHRDTASGGGRGVTGVYGGAGGDRGQQRVHPSRGARDAPRVSPLVCKMPPAVDNLVGCVGCSWRFFFFFRVCRVC